ncbi:hypothetical protein, partial [Pseudomonas viridiflava]|uniref:hypothetical protein n=1 Tax=Pseudomonas viridiflava TaxID=33069 RepID=UPI0019CF6E6F
MPAMQATRYVRKIASSFIAGKRAPAKEQCFFSGWQFVLIRADYCETAISSISNTSGVNGSI